MRRTGELIALAAGVCGAFAALDTLIVAGALGNAGRVPLVAFIEWRGAIFSALVIALAARRLACGSRRIAAYLLTVALAATFLSGMLVSFWMAFASLGGFMALTGETPDRSRP